MNSQYSTSTIGARVIDNGGVPVFTAEAEAGIEAKVRDSEAAAARARVKAKAEV